MKKIPLAPEATQLLESLRSLGYSAEAAVADLIDNSITAEASAVEIRFPAGPPVHAAIIDDGKGMSAAELVQAMRHGSRSPIEARSPNDLGRFGLGLKTASLSQCRCLTVVSKQHGEISACRWDLDFIRDANKAMVDRGLLPDFSAEALAQASRIAGPAVAADGSVRNLRELPWCSIDNDDSRDLDQLSVSEPLPGGAVKILVAIADVDARVEKDTAIDVHARTNTTSVYTAARIFPMLPEKLSTHLTSLNEGEERLAVVIEMSVRTDGSVASADVYRAVVFNHAKLAYNAIAAWLEGSAPAPPKLAAVPGLDEQLRVQDGVAQA